jgi:hypothetical protein
MVTVQTVCFSTKLAYCDKNMQPFFLFLLGSSRKVVIFKWLGLPKAEAMLSFPLGAVFALGIYALWQCCGLGLCS